MLNQILDQIQDDGRRQAYTLTALFDDIIDAEQALMQLRRGQQPAAQVSVILRERVLDYNSQTPHRTVLSEVVQRSSLEAASTWLQGLVSLVLPDRATYLAAGPIGMILSTIQESPVVIEDEHDSIGERPAPTRQLTRTLQAFGFNRDEATYVEQRVVVGSPLIAATSEDVETLRGVHRIFSHNTPVYLGLARTDRSVFSRAARLVTTGPRGSGSVVIADAVSPLVHLANTQTLANTERDLRGRIAHSQYGEIMGRVTDVLYEPEPDTVPSSLAVPGVSDDQYLLRYIIVRLGGRLGLGRQRIAIPAERVNLESNDVVIRITHEEMVAAPRFDGSSTLSRQDEAAIRRHFDEPFYWIGNNG
jgi:uncharacterized protein YrrD